MTPGSDLPLRTSEDHDVRPEGRASKLTEKNLVQNLLFAFFGHTDEYGSIQGKARYAEKIEELSGICKILFGAISSKQFNRDRHTWITDAMIADNFKKRQVYQCFGYIKSGTIPYTNSKSIKARNIFSAICAISRDIFDDTTDAFEYVGVLRSQLKISEPSETYRNQFGLLGQIERALKKIADKPSGAISFDSQDQPVIRTSRHGLFPKPQELEQDEITVSGRYIVYRRAFTVAFPSRPYIREYLVIERKPYGVTFHWETRGLSDRESAIDGVGFFTQGAFWLVGHCDYPFQRMRMMATNVVEWQRYKAQLSDRDSFCTSKILSVMDGNGEKTPASRTVILRQERPDEDWRQEDFKNRVKFLSKDELLLSVTPDAVRLIDMDN